jgi:uncharacterized membrane protein YeaQ/YmgE (transglycosylase-associated protein family)
MGIIAWVIFGFIVGLIARAVVPGRQQMGFVMTTLLGIAGSVVGGLVGSALSGASATGLQTAGFLGSLIGAVVLLIIAEMAVPARRREV